MPDVSVAIQCSQKQTLIKHLSYNSASNIDSNRTHLYFLNFLPNPVYDYCPVFISERKICILIKFKYKRSNLLFAVFGSCSVLSNHAFAENISKETLSYIQDYANNVCALPPLDGKISKENLEIKLEGSLGKFLKFISPSLSVATEGNFEQYSGLMKDQIIQAVDHSYECKFSVTKVIIENINQENNPESVRGSIIGGKDEINTVNNISGNGKQVNETYNIHGNRYIIQPSVEQEKFYRVKNREESETHKTKIEISKVVEEKNNLVVFVKNNSLDNIDNLKIRIPRVDYENYIFGIKIPKNLSLESMKTLPVTVSSISIIERKIQTDGPVKRIIGFGTIDDLNKQCWDTDLSEGLATVCNKMKDEHIDYVITQGFPIQMEYTSITEEKVKSLMQFLVYSTY